MRRPMTAMLALPMAVAVAMGTPRAEAGPLNPDAFASLGTLDLTGGSYVFDTTNDTLSTASGTVLYTGVTSNGIAVFDFSGITLGGATITATGNDSLALLSRGNIGLTDTSLNLDGGQGGFNHVGAGGPGGGAGGAISAPGIGPGAGVGSGGGGFGGAGGLTSFSNGQGGQAYGNLGVQLTGGSGGGGLAGGGGGGGGAIEIGAIGSLGLNNSTIAATGGGGTVDGGGGGSGGGILLHAGSVSLIGSDLLDVSGGSGSPFSNFVSGGGGGGRVLIVTDSFTLTGAGNFANLAGGAGVLGGGNGGDGVLTIDRISPASVPEPSSLILLGLALPIVARAWRRRAS